MYAIGYLMNGFGRVGFELMRGVGSMRCYRMVYGIKRWYWRMCRFLLCWKVGNRILIIYKYGIIHNEQ